MQCVGFLWGENQDCVPACCIILRVISYIIVSGDDRYLHVWYYPMVSRVHPGCQGASCCVMLSRFLCDRISVYLRGPLVAYVWVVHLRVLFGGI